MRILFIAPQPFFQERGTPIAVDLALRVLSSHGEEIHLITYAEGGDMDYPHVLHFRTPSFGLLTGIKPGFSLKKLASSALVLVKAITLAARGRYDLVHAVEEGAFIALVLKVLFGLPYIYDMDSSMAQQLVEQKPRLRFLAPFFSALEGLAIRHSTAVLPVCQALADVAKRQGGKKITVLNDVSLLNENPAVTAVTDIKKEYSVQGLLLLYVGNLEKYQGVDLLLESFALALKEENIPKLDMALIGGAPADRARYAIKCGELGIEGNVHILGPRPVSDLGAYLAQADMLASPRIKGNNTPMKVYTYLHSGKVVLATNIGSHTQVVNGESALLVDPDPYAMMKGIKMLALSPALREKLGSAGRMLIEEKYSFPSFEHKLLEFYASLKDTRVDML